jgi:hypothetical protein
MTTNITKKYFCDVINKIQKVNKIADGAADAMDVVCKELDNDFIEFRGLFMIFQDDLIDLLEKAVGDEYDTVGWFIYETDCGRDSDRNKIYEDNGYTVHVIDSPEVLYDYLMNSNQNKE